MSACKFDDRELCSSSSLLCSAIYGGKYEFTYTSVSSVNIKHLASGKTVTVKSKAAQEIKKINIYQDK